jgi:hypothetical protein
MPTPVLSAKDKRLLAQHHVHGTLLRWMYRLLAPRHPRGWLDFHALTDEHDPELLCSVHCHGMARWNLPNLEIVNVPRDLGGYAHGIMFDIAGYMRSQRTIKADETLGGKFVGEHQVVPHYCSFRAVRLDDEPTEKDLLRIVDLNETAESGFPKRLFAAHILALAEKTRDPTKRAAMLRRAVTIHPGEPNSGPDDESAATENPGNFFSWYSLGDALCDAGELEEGLQCLRTAVGRWPCGGRKNAAVIVEAIRSGQLPPPDRDARSKFWTEVAAQHGS